jgi:hypothetical protein
VVYDCDRNCSEVWIFNSEHLDQEPIARLELPDVIPMGFHGTWQSLTTWVDGNWDQWNLVYKFKISLCTDLFNHLSVLF